MASSALFVFVCFLAYANGANDNFKEVATLFGSGTANYRLALSWATLTTLAGSICALFLAQTLMIKFSGKGLAPDALIQSLPFMILAPGFNVQWIIVVIAVAMLLGGLFNARRVAETMSRKITPITQGQGLSANLATALLVIFASKFGMPVSTTHVSVGALFGIGLVGGKANVG